MLSWVVILQSQPAPPLFTSLLLYLLTSPLFYFHTLTNCPSRNSHGMTTIRMPGGVGSKAEVQAKVTVATCWGRWFFQRNGKSRQARSSDLMGSRRMRFPVPAKMALQTAGAITGRPGSPMPVGSSVLLTMCTSIFGVSLIRGIW